MFDYLLTLIDGSKDLIGDNDTPASSTSITSGTGAKVIDLGEGGTPASGLSAVLLLPTTAIASSTLTGKIEGSEEEDFLESSYQVHELGKFDIAAATEGIILAAEVISTTVPLAVIIRFATKLRFIRVNLTVNGTTEYNFYRVKCYLTPYAFHVL